MTRSGYSRFPGMKAVTDPTQKLQERICGNFKMEHIGIPEKTNEQIINNSSIYNHFIKL